MMSSKQGRIRVWLTSVLLAAVAASAYGSPARFRIEVRDDGVYGIPYEDLAAAGLKGQPGSDLLALSHRGVPVPVRV